MLQDGAHLLLAVHKPFAAHNLTGMDLGMLALGQGVDGKCLVHILPGSLEGGGHPDNLTEGTLVAAVGVVVGALGRYHHLGHVEVGGGTARHTGGDDEVGVVVVYHLHRPDCTVHLADAALLHHHFIVANLADDEVLVVLALCLRFGQ